MKLVAGCYQIQFITSIRTQTLSNVESTASHCVCVSAQQILVIPLKEISYICFGNVACSHISCTSHICSFVLSSNSIEKAILNTIKAIEHKGFHVSSSLVLIYVIIGWFNEIRNGLTRNDERATSDRLPPLHILYAQEYVMCVAWHFGFIGHCTKKIKYELWFTITRKPCLLVFKSDISCNACHISCLFKFYSNTRTLNCCDVWYLPRQNVEFPNEMKKKHRWLILFGIKNNFRFGFIWGEIVVLIRIWNVLNVQHWIKMTEFCRNQHIPSK